MGIKQRQERDREAVRRAILDAARELFVSEGYNNVSIRKIAERIEYSPASIYSYFPSKDDIFFELAEEGFRLLSDPARAVRSDFAVLAPLDRIRAMFWRLYEFSRDHDALKVVKDQQDGVACERLAVVAVGHIHFRRRVP